jgi:hypothetical protein
MKLIATYRTIGCFTGETHMAGFLMGGKFEGERIRQKSGQVGVHDMACSQWAGIWITAITRLKKACEKML